MNGRLLIKVITIVSLLCGAGPALAEMVSIARPSVHMRSGPGTNSPVRFELAAGFPLQVLGRKGGWLRVRDFEGDVGWVSAALVSRAPRMIVKAKRVNLRRGPGTRFAVVGHADYASILATRARSGNWVEVRARDGRIGWVRRDLVWGW